MTDEMDHSDADFVVMVQGQSLYHEPLDNPYATSTDTRCTPSGFNPHNAAPVIRSSARRLGRVPCPECYPDGDSDD